MWLKLADAEIFWDISTSGDLIAGVVAITRGEETDSVFAEQFPVDPGDRTLAVASTSPL